MNTLLQQCMTALKNQPCSQKFEVYPAFDMIPVVNKSGSIFIIIGMEKLHFALPFFNGQSCITPFTADFRVSVLMPINTPESKLLDVFYQIAVPGMQNAGGILCDMQTQACSPDFKLQKMTYTGIFRLKGIFQPDQEAET